MAGSPDERRLPDDELERMVGVVRPDWRVQEFSLAADGVTPVYHVRVSSPQGERAVVLKAARGDDGHLAVGDVAAEARLLSVLADRTTIPVPEVVGAVDDLEAVRTPCFLMAAMDGGEVPPDEVGSLSSEVLRRVARQSGRYLAELHGLDFDGVTSFGRGVHADPGRSLQGERPSGDPDELVLTEGYDDFRDQLRAWWTEDFGSGLADTRFADLVPAVRAALERRLEDLEACGEPTLARLDHGFHNLLVDRASGAVDAVLDWGNLAAFPPAYHLALVEIRLAGGPWLALPEVPDRRSTVRDALLEGYRRARPAPPDYPDRRGVYQLDVFQSWLQALGDDPAAHGVPSSRVDDAAAGFRTLVAPLLD